MNVCCVCFSFGYNRALEGWFRWHMHAVRAARLTDRQLDGLCARSIYIIYVPRAYEMKSHSGRNMCDARHMFPSWRFQCGNVATHSILVTVAATDLLSLGACVMGGLYKRGYEFPTQIYIKKNVQMCARTMTTPPKKINCHVLFWARYCPIAAYVLLPTENTRQNISINSLNRFFKHVSVNKNDTEALWLVFCTNIFVLLSVHFLYWNWSLVKIRFLQRVFNHCNFIS